jgi:hypothetical protein
VQGFVYQSSPGKGLLRRAGARLFHTKEKTGLWPAQKVAAFSSEPDFLWIRLFAPGSFFPKENFSFYFKTNNFTQ